MDRRLMNTSFLRSQIEALHELHRAPLEEYGELVTSLNKECDILCLSIPGYKVRPLNEQGGVENEEDGDGGGGKQRKKQKKEVHNVERLELELLTQYERFLQLVARLRKKNHPESQALGSRLCARLVGAASEFNHSDRLMQLAVAYANAKSSRAAQPCITALTAFLDGQLVTDSTLHVAEAILALVKKDQRAINPKVIAILLHLRVAMIDTHRPDVAEERAKDKRQKKEDKELARLLQKANARTNRADLAAKQTVVLQRVFSTFLRVLQAARTCQPAHQTRILAPTLEGLAKFAPLVNLEMYQLLLKALREIIDAEETAVITKLHALVAVACLAERDATLKDPHGGKSSNTKKDGTSKKIDTSINDWKTDMAHYHNVLFQCLMEALSPPQTSASEKAAAHEHEDNQDSDADGSAATQTSDNASIASTASRGSLSSQAFSIAASMAQQKHVQKHAALEWTYRARLVVRAMDLFFLSQKHLPLVRVAGIVRRALQFAPHCPPNVTLALVAMSHKLMAKYPAIAGMAIGGNDFATTGRGSYDPQSTDLHTCNADASFAWEIPVLQRSFHPVVRQLMDGVTAYYTRVAKATSSRTNGGGVAAVAQPLSLSSIAPYDLLDSYDTSLGEVRPAPPRRTYVVRSSVVVAGAKDAKRGRDVVGATKKSAKKKPNAAMAVVVTSATNKNGAAAVPPVVASKKLTLTALDRHNAETARSVPSRAALVAGGTPPTSDTGAAIGGNASGGHAAVATATSPDHRPARRSVSFAVSQPDKGSPAAAHPAKRNRSS